MNPQLILTITIGLLSINSAFAELKYFLPRSRACMSVLDMKYWFEGDTIIDNKRYTKVYEQYCYSATECSDNLRYFAAIREDTTAEKLYCLHVDDGEERLIADFDVKAGDEIMVASYWGYELMDDIWYTQVEIESVDSVLIQNQYRKRINVCDRYPGNVKDSWIEGIGSIGYGLLFPFAPGIPDARDAPVFICFQENDRLIYRNPNFESCYAKDMGVNIPANTYSNYAIFPTLVNDRLFVNMPNSIGSYSMFNYQGQWVKSGSLPVEFIDISDLQLGIYQIIFYDNDKSRIYSNRFIKR